MTGRPARRRDAALALAATLALLPIAARAASNYVDDGAHLLSPDTVAHINAIDDTLAIRPGKNVIVVTAPGLGGPSYAAAVQTAATAHHMTGALIYVTAADKGAAIVLSPRVSPLFPARTFNPIVSDLVNSVKSGQADAGVTKAFDQIADTIAGGASGGHGPAPAQVVTSREHWTGADASWIWWIAGFIVALLIIRAIFARRTARDGSRA